MFCTHKNNQSGFSLVEILITISILVVAISLAAPPLTSFIENNRMTSAANKLVSAINYARNEAISRRAIASIETNDEGSWDVKVTPLATGVESTIANFELDDGITLSSAIDITFTADGYRDLSEGIPLRLNIEVTDVDSKYYRTVSIGPSGITSVTKGTKETEEGS